MRKEVKKYFLKRKEKHPKTLKKLRRKKKVTVRLNSGLSAAVSSGCC
jgi:hypothetical protein